MIWVFPSWTRRGGMSDPVKAMLVEGIVRITLNRPQYFNAFDIEMIRMLAEKLTGYARNRDVGGVVITGEGKAFCAGGDLRAVAGLGRPFGEAFHELAAIYHQAIVEIRRMPKPVVAAINGLAAGGGFSLALACDFRVMASSAQLRQAYTSNGLSIDGGGTFTLPRLVGMARALEIAAFDPPISAEQAIAWGLVTEVVDDGSTTARAHLLAENIKRGALTSFAASKELISDAFSTPFEAQLEKERRYLSSCADHPNGHEGITAFLEKRKPLYEET
jgi:2-(1,2-epoxy-1,2-dihydrophenyl)acetyl-CoA isomerase